MFSRAVNLKIIELIYHFYRVQITMLFITNTYLAEERVVIIYERGTMQRMVFKMHNMI